MLKTERVLTVDQHLGESEGQQMIVGAEHYRVSDDQAFVKDQSHSIDLWRNGGAFKENLARR